MKTTMQAPETTVNEKVFELLEKTKTNWTVTKEELQSVSGYKKTESFGLFRSDNSQWLGTVGTQYVPMQNHELAETLIRASEGIGISLQKGGTFGSGKKVYYQAKLENMHIGASMLERYITTMTSHDGTMSTGFGSSNTNIICQNTFHRAYREISKFRHTATALERIEVAMLEMRGAMGMDEKLMESFKKMTDVPISKGIFSSLMEKIFDVDLEKKESDYHTKTRNRLIQLNEAIEKDVSIHGSNLWALFNGITRYTNHYVSHKNEEEKNRYLMTGAGYKTNLATYDEIIDWIDKHSAKTFAVSAN